MLLGHAFFTLTLELEERVSASADQDHDLDGRSSCGGQTILHACANVIDLRPFFSVWAEASCRGMRAHRVSHEIPGDIGSAIGDLLSALPARNTASICCRPVSPGRVVPEPAGVTCEGRSSHGRCSTSNCLSGLAHAVTLPALPCASQGLGDMGRASPLLHRATTQLSSVPPDTWASGACISWQPSRARHPGSCRSNAGTVRVSSAPASVSEHRTGGQFSACHVDVCAYLDLIVRDVRPRFSDSQMEESPPREIASAFCSRISRQGASSPFGRAGACAAAPAGCAIVPVPREWPSDVEPAESATESGFLGPNKMPPAQRPRWPPWDEAASRSEVWNHWLGTGGEGDPGELPEAWTESPAFLGRDFTRHCRQPMAHIHVEA